MEFLSRLLVNKYRCMYLSDEQFYAYTVHAESASNRFAPRRIGDMLAIGSRIGSLSETVEEPRLKRFLAGKSLFLFTSHSAICHWMNIMFIANGF